MATRRTTQTWFGHLTTLCLAIMVAVSLAVSASAEEAVDILEQSGVKGGMVVHLGCGNGELTAQLRAGEQYLVQGLDTDAAGVPAARDRLREQGVYGPVSLDVWDGKHLPYADNLVNLIVAEDPGQASQDELLRALAPNGVLLQKNGDEWKKTVKPRPDEIDEWTHYLHSSTGNPVAQDKVVGPPKRLQWIGSPRWARHHDHMASMTSLVSTGGRLFYILDEGPRASIQLPSDWNLVARDAFNGTILWKRHIERWNTRQYPLKSGPAHLLRRLVAIGEDVYVTLGIDAPLTVLDAATGETKLTFKGSEYTREIVACDGMVLLVADSSPSPLPDWRRVSTYVWDNTRRANPDWGWQGNARKILAYDAASGKSLWNVEAPVAPCSLAADATRAVFHDGGKLVCLDRTSGDKLWETDAAPTAIPVHTNTGPRVLLYGEVVLFAGNDGKMSGWSIDDGRKLWEQKHRPSGHQSLKDLMVAGGLAWTGEIAGNSSSGVFTGYDPLSGEVKREFPADVQVHWFHHRCYPSKATDDYVLTARNGTEFVDLEKEHWQPHHWFRGGCIYGVMPCNGMTYASMDACGCQLEAKLSGFKALAVGPVPQPGKDGVPDLPRLQKGPAFGRVDGPNAAGDDWPTYRHDAARSGATGSAVPTELGQAWQAKLGGHLSAPTVAAGKVFVAAIDEHTVHALDAATGKSLWSFTSGGRVDSPPTYYRGLVLFGSADGYVYALDGADGSLAWRFRGAPVDRRMTAWEQIESAWPVHGSVLVHNGVLYCTAGRNMFLEGGIHFLRLDPTSGRLLGEVVMDDVDPESGEEMHLAYLKKTSGNNMPVALSDVLSCDGENIWMRSQKIDFEGKRSEIGLKDVTDQPVEDFHLFCQVGFLDDSYFFRSYWTFGRRVSGGYGAWLKAGRLVPSGRILCFDDTHVYGFGRKPEYMVNSSVLEYQLFSADKKVTREAIERVTQAGRKMNARSTRRNANSSDWRLRSFFPQEDLTAASFGWILPQPTLTARAMAVGKETVFVAGPPNYLDERRAYSLPDDPKILARLTRQQEALEGRHGGVLWALDKAGGDRVARYELDTIPVFDGMAAAAGCLFVSTVDGRVLCLSKDADTRLKRIENQPERLAWDQPEDPNYLAPPEIPKEGDFDHVARSKVIESDLGYRMVAKGNNRNGLALNKLDEPITGAAVFKTRMLVPARDTGMSRNGFLAFGSGTGEAKLIHCGARLKLKKVLLIQGSIDEGKSQSVTVNVPDGKPIDIVVKVDLDTQQVTYTAAGVTLEAKLERPLKSITHVGYSMDSALVDFSPVEIQRD